jgi:cyclophilin family peptidyl-prolyl cis-trans isomerase
MGNIKIALRQDKSPISVANFLEYVKAGHYNGTIFHRVKSGFMIQGGGMDATMAERPTRKPIRNEAKNGLRNSRGTVAMARLDDPDSATAQFFINVVDNPFLDFGIKGAGYAVFGEVVEGMEVVDKIAAVPTTRKGHHDDVPVTAVVLQKARLEGAAK